MEKAGVASKPVIYFLGLSDAARGAKELPAYRRKLSVGQVTGPGGVALWSVTLVRADGCAAPVAWAAGRRLVPDTGGSARGLPGAAAGAAGWGWQRL